LRATAGGEPLRVYACSCLECQRRSGSVFTYSAWFPISAVTIEGEHRSWRRGSRAGRWSESFFCPTCGTSVFTTVEALPDDIGIWVGCFADQSFARPAALVWASKRHHWLELPAGVKAIEEQ
jgi:hypothetical protein